MTIENFIIKAKKVHGNKYDYSLVKYKNNKTKKYPIVFENDFFILYGKKYSYNGLKIQKIN